jgi:hypothetical protein
MGLELEAAREAYEFLTNDRWSLADFTGSGTGEAHMEEIRRLAATYLPPEHREVIADRLGCSDVPVEFWRRFQEFTTGNCEAIVLNCDCGRFVGLVRLSLSENILYYAGLCQSDDGLSGCLTVWWTRRKDTPLYDHDEEARGYAVMD